MIEVPKGARHHCPSYNHAGYLESYIIPELLADTINKATMALKVHDTEFDAIAFSGLSGLLVGPTVALLTGKTMIAVRKPSDMDGNCHSTNLVEGDHGARSYIIVDDFVCSSNTMKRIKKAIFDWAPDMRYAGMLETHYLTWDDNEHTKLCPNFRNGKEVGGFLTYRPLF